MHERDQARGPEEIERRGPEIEPPGPEAAEGVLALQRSAGNQAVSAYLARSPDGGKTKEPEKKPQTPAAAGARATLPGIGTIAILSVQRLSGGSGGRGTLELHDMTFSSKVGGHSAQLMRAVVEGKPMDVEVVLPGGKSTLRIKLAGALVSGYSTSGDGPDAIETWTLNFQSAEQTFEGERDE